MENWLGDGANPNAGNPNAGNPNADVCGLPVVPITLLVEAPLPGVFMYFHLELQGQRAGELPNILVKNPDRIHELEVLGCPVRVFFSSKEPDRSRLVLLFWPDNRGLSRKNQRFQRPTDEFGPRPYAINSVFCVALRTIFSSVMTPRETSVLAEAEESYPFELVLSPVCSYLSPDRILALFQPLHFSIEIQEFAQVEFGFPQRRPRVYELKVTGRSSLQDLLRQLFVLIFVMDSDRHEYTGKEEVEHLRQFGQGWLEIHPERSFIISRYLIYRRLIDTFQQLANVTHREEAPEQFDDGYDATPEPLLYRASSDSVRCDQIVDILSEWPRPFGKILQFGCGDGRLIASLVAQGDFEVVAGVDSSAGTLEKMRRRVERERRFGQVLRTRLTRFDLFVSSLGYQDPRLTGFDAIILWDIFELHDPSKLSFLLSPMLDRLKPRLVLLTAPAHTPNATLDDRTDMQRKAWEKISLLELGQTIVAGKAYSIDIRRLGHTGPDQPAPYQVALFYRHGELP